MFATGENTVKLRLFRMRYNSITSISRSKQVVDVQEEAGRMACLRSRFLKQRIEVVCVFAEDRNRRLGSATWTASARAQFAADHQSSRLRSARVSSDCRLFACERSNRLELDADIVNSGVNTRNGLALQSTTKQSVRLWSQQRTELGFGFWFGLGTHVAEPRPSIVNLSGLSSDERDYEALLEQTLCTARSYRYIDCRAGANRTGRQL